MDWTPIITAAVTGGLAVLGQWLISRKKTIEDDIKNKLREQNQNERLDKIEAKLERVDERLDGYGEKLDAQAKQIEENSVRSMRLDLFCATESDPGNKLMIIDMAKKYFFGMKGNCYMSKKFQEWADKYHVNITSIFDNN